ncbi:MAG: hypothetical protein VX672_06545 [Planctomycetota bacterium]|nr:hypothetical protein [Planctomycetota bacterium]
MPDSAADCARLPIRAVAGWHPVPAIACAIAATVPSSMVAAADPSSGFTAPERETVVALPAPILVDLDPMHPIHRDVPPLDVLDLIDDPVESRPRIGGFGRLRDTVDPTVGRRGIGGLDLSWRADERISIAVVAGGRMNAIDGGRIGAAPGPTVLEEAETSLENLAGRPTSFDGLGFGGELASEVSPFEAGRVFQSAGTEDDLRAAFLATRAVFQPGRGTRFGFVVTNGGSEDGDVSVFGFDLSQELAGHRLDAWVQQSSGIAGDGDGEQDRSAIGASLAGRVVGLSYSMGWRRIGDGFESGLGNAGRPGSHALSGRLDWGIDLVELPLVKRWEFGVRARYDTDLDFEANTLGLNLDATRLLMESGDRIEFGLRQIRRQDGVNLDEIDTHERFRLAVISDPRQAVRWRSEVTFGDPDDTVGTSWRGSARWSPGGGFDLGGTIRVDRPIDGGETRETMRTAIDGGFRIGAVADIRSRVDYDAANEAISLGQGIGIRLRNAASVSITVEQKLPSTRGVDQVSRFRARVGGRFEF